MSQYATQAEFLDQTLPAEAFSTLPAGTIDKALIWASSRADSHVRKKYALPLISWSEDLRSAVCDIAAWRLMRYRGFKPGSGASESITEGKTDAFAWLKDVAEGLCELANVVDSSPALDEDSPLVDPGETVDWSFFTSSDDSSCGCTKGCG